MGRGASPAVSFGRGEHTLRRHAPLISAQLEEILLRDLSGDYDEEENILTTGHNPICDLTPGQIDSEAISWYKHGNCHVLATEIARATGWPMVLVASPDEDPSTGKDLVIHVLVKCPDGRAIDIEGVRDMEDAIWEWQEKFPTLYTKEVTEADLVSFADPDSDDLEEAFQVYTESERALTRDFAHLLLREHCAR